MERGLALLVYYARSNRYGFNALVGSLEADERFEGLEVRFARDERELFSELEELSGTYERVVVAFSFFTTQVFEVGELMRRLRERFRGEKVVFVAGGPHPTGDPLGTLKLGFDVVVLGEGEVTIRELLRKIEKGEDLSSLAGIAFLKDGEVFRTKRPPRVDLNEFPPFAVRHEKFGPIEITRGCPFACYFCQTPYLFGAGIRHRSVDKVCEFVEVLKRQGLTDVRFITPNAFAYGSKDGRSVALEEVERLLKGVREVLGKEGRIFFGSFPSEVRPEHVTRETVELVLRYANNDNLVIGAQSGSERVLELCHRQHTVEDVYRAVRLTLKAGLKANVDFIFGLPGETEEDIRETIRVMEELSEMGARIHAHTFMPLPQTPFANAPPGRVKESLWKVIKKLVSRGALYGSWRAQEEVAKRISSYYRELQSQGKTENGLGMNRRS